MSDNASLRIWQALQPMIRKEITKGTESSVKSKKMVVTTAYNTTTRTVGVTEAFGSEIQVPVAGGVNPNSLTVGRAVWVIALHGSWSNAMVCMFGDGTNGYDPNDYIKKSDLYPVGSVYLTFSEENPAAFYGGSWVRIEDMFLLGASSKYRVGTLGGEEKHELTIGELPNHAHAVYMNNAGTETPYYGAANAVQQDGNAYNFTGTVGENQPHNNMPPYIAVYIWRRIR